MTRALQSTPFQNPGVVPSARQTNGRRTEILVSNIGCVIRAFKAVFCPAHIKDVKFGDTAVCSANSGVKEGRERLVGRVLPLVGLSSLLLTVMVIVLVVTSLISRSAQVAPHVTPPRPSY